MGCVMPNSRCLTRFVFVSTALLLLSGLSVSAASGQEAASQWRYAAGLYLWAAGLNGDVTLGGQTVAVEASFGDIVDNLDAGGQARLEATNGRWGVLGDVIYIDLSHETERLSAELGAKQTILEILGARRFGTSFDLLLGGRYNELDNQIQFGGPLGLPTLKDGHSWIDPMVGGRWVGGSDRLHLTLRGDLAGFGVGSDLTWNAEGVFAYDITERFLVGLGYRITDAEFEEGQGAGKFRYDMRTDGPMLGFGIRF